MELLANLDGLVRLRPLTIIQDLTGQSRSASPHFTIDGQLPTSVLHLSFRFKTSNPNGLLLHLIATDFANSAVESQLLLQLKDGKIDVSHTAKGENSAAQETTR